MQKSHIEIMMKKLIILLLIGSSLASCVSRKKIVYFQDLEEQQILLDDIQNSFKIQPNDLISIIVSAYNLETVRPFNIISETRAPSTISAGSVDPYQSATQQAYLTAEDGTIDFPVLGNLKVAGLTRSELSEMLIERISEYVINPIVTIRVLNFKVSILGEVNSPGTYSASGERLTIPEAIGMAGDLSIYGKRDNILVIRDNGGKREYKYLNMLDSNILNSPYYYLKQNDVLYIEPNNAQIQGASFNRNTTIYISVASLLLSVLVLVFK